MANWQAYEVKSRTPKAQLLFGEITVGASGAVSSQDCDGFTVAKEATAGQYTLTLDETFNKFLALDTTIIDATDVLFDTVLSEDVDGAKTIVVQLWDADTPAATDATSGTVLKFAIAVKNTSL